MVQTQACQVLCMISEYHMACVTRGSSVMSPILPEAINDQLPPLSGYICQEDDLSLTDVRVWDHQAKTLRVVMWLHRMDMALSGEPATLRSLVQARHHRGHLLGYLLAPGTAGDLWYEEVIDQVLRENQGLNVKK